MFLNPPCLQPAGLKGCSYVEMGLSRAEEENAGLIPNTPMAWTLFPFFLRSLINGLLVRWRQRRHWWVQPGWSSFCCSIFFPPSWNVRKPCLSNRLHHTTARNVTWFQRPILARVRRSAFRIFPLIAAKSASIIKNFSEFGCSEIKNVTFWFISLLNPITCIPLFYQKHASEGRFGIMFAA